MNFFEGSSHDVVNVVLPEPSSEVPLLRRARLLERVENGFLAQIEGLDAPQRVDLEQIRQRVSLPWKPKDLRDHLIFFRRRNATKEEYVEDLRTRRTFVQNLMQLLTMEAFWRADEISGPMHQYYTGFDTRTTAQIEEVFPEDDVPEGLHFEDVEDFEHPDAFTENQFIEWLTEGRHDCEVAQALLHTWTRFLKGTPSDTLSDFYHDLLHEAEEEEDVEEKSREKQHQPFLSYSYRNSSEKTVFCRSMWQQVNRLILKRTSNSEF